MRLLEREQKFFRQRRKELLAQRAKKEPERLIEPKPLAILPSEELKAQP